jgi:hypothetical protein
VQDVRVTAKVLFGTESYNNSYSALTMQEEGMNRGESKTYRI